MSSAFARNLARPVLAAPSVPQTQWGVEEGTLIHTDVLPQGPYVTIGVEASPPLTPLSDFAPFDRVCSAEGESVLTSVPLEWFLGSSDIDLSAGGLTPSTASSAPPAAASATDPAAAATAARCSERIQQRTASQPSQTCLDAAAAPPAARRRRRGRSTKSAKTAKTAKTGTAPLKPRPSALKRRVGAGLKGRPRNGEGFPWHVPAVQKRMRQLKDLYLAGKLTQTKVAEMLRNEFKHMGANHSTVCRRFSRMP